MSILEQRIQQKLNQVSLLEQFCNLEFNYDLSGMSRFILLIKTSFELHDLIFEDI